MTWKTLKAVWRRSTVPPVPAHLRFWVQMETSSEKNKILERWCDHLDGVLNRPSSISNKAIAGQPQVPVNESLDVTPTLGEVQIAIHQLPNDKASGTDNIRSVDQHWRVNFSSLYSWHGWKTNTTRLQGRLHYLYLQTERKTTDMW